MNFIQRLGYYGAGLAIGIVVLLFFLNGKNASCSYFPSERVLKNLRIKERIYSNEAKQSMIAQKIDTAEIRKALTTGDVDFNKSQTKLDSCKIYYVTNFLEAKKELALTIKNCDSIVTIQKVEILSLK